jgi:hypothetical protein
MDMHGSTPDTLDRTDDLLIPRWSRQLRHLLFLGRLYDRGLRSILCFCYW